MSALPREFEVQIENIGSIAERNAPKHRSETVALPPAINDFAEFTIAIL